jgi:RNA-binding protein 25
VRWRSQRKALRTREAEADARDREHEARQLAALNDRSDSFLAQHADLLASSLPPNASQTGSPRGGGTNGTGGSTPGAAAAGGVKLSFNAAAAKPAAQEVPKARPTALALEDEEETNTKKRELIPLEYSDDDDDEGAPPKPRMTRTEMERKAREIEEKVPTSKEGLWALKIRWKRLSDVRPRHCFFLYPLPPLIDPSLHAQDIIKRRIEPYANRAIVGYLGAEEPELVNVITEYLRAHKTPQELLEELEPVRHSPRH